MYKELSLTGVGRGGIRYLQFSVSDKTEGFSLVHPGNY